MKLFFSLILSLSFTILSGQGHSTKDISISEFIDGTLIQPEKADILIIIIAGSGPVDRNGNQNFSRSDYLKKLALNLAQKNIATFRYDKRVVKQLKTGTIDPKISFDDFVSDAVDVIGYFQKDSNFSKVFVLGHSQGSLVAMQALNEQVTGFISVAGASKNIGDVLIEQVGRSAPIYALDTERIIAQLKKGQTTTDYPQALAAAFNLETQPFLISWMTYEPSKIIEDISIPILILQGTKDLQISIKDAETLKAHCSNCQLQIIEDMNHVLVDIKGDQLENYKSYNDTNFKLSQTLTNHISRFVQSN